MSVTNLLYDKSNEKLTANIEIENIGGGLSDFVMSNLNAVTDRYHTLIGIINDICQLWEDEGRNIVCKNSVSESPTTTIIIEYPNKDLTVKLICGNTIDKIEIEATKTSTGVYIGFFDIYVLHENTPGLVSNVVYPPNSHLDILDEFKTCLQEYCHNFKLDIMEFKEPKKTDEE